MSQEYKVEISIPIKAPASNVWQALTEPQILISWMSGSGITMTVETDWRVGSSICFMGSLHGIDYTNKGVIKTFKPEKRLEYSFWSSLSQIADRPEHYSLLSFTLNKISDGTLLELSQKPFLLETMMQHSNFYWRVALANLKDLLEVP